MIKTFQDDVDMSQSDEAREEEEEEVYSDEDEGSYDEEEDEDEDEEAAHEAFKQDKAKNSQLAVGYKDRSFVVRGDKIGVFRHNERDGLDFATTITNLTNKSGREVNPSRVSNVFCDRQLIGNQSEQDTDSYQVLFSISITYRLFCNNKILQ